MATTLTTFKAYITPDVLPCPDIIVERELIRAIQEFCIKSQILRKNLQFDLEDHDAIDSTLQNSIDIDISTDLANYRIVSLIRYNLDGIDYIPKQKEFVNTASYFDTMEQYSSGVKYFYVVDDTTLRIYDMVSADADLWIECAVKPLDTVSSVDDVLFDDWLDAITAKAKSRILMMPSKVWSDPKAAAAYHSEYKRELSKARMEVLKQKTNNSQELYPQAFGGVILK